MQPPRKRTLSNALGNARSDHLKSLLDSAANHARLERAVSQSLPSHLRNLCRFGNYQEGELVLVTTGSAQASQLRLYQHEILGTLRQQDMHFQFAWKLKAKVNPHQENRSRQNKRKKISGDNARLLQEEARHTENEQLRDVLLKLSRHTNGPSSAQ